MQKKRVVAVQNWWCSRKISMMILFPCFNVVTLVKVVCFRIVNIMKECQLTNNDNILHWIFPMSYVKTFLTIYYIYLQNEKNQSDVKRKYAYLCEILDPQVGLVMSAWGSRISYKWVFLKNLSVYAEWWLSLLER